MSVGVYNFALADSYGSAVTSDYTAVGEIPLRGVGDIQPTYSASDTAAQLKQRLPNQLEHRYNFVLENDLAGRAALSILWPHRGQLNIHLVTQNPDEHSISAMRSAFTSVRTPPTVDVVVPTAVRELVSTQQPLIWAVTSERSDATVRALLAQRAPGLTHFVYSEPLDALSGQHPDQTDPSHEIVLRDIMHQHARFLNFFGDRLDPRDLYERSKYPDWFTPPPNFTAPIPPITSSIIDADGSIEHQDEFGGVLQLAPEQVKTNHRTTVSFQPVLNSMEAASFDLSLQVHNAYDNPRGAGALAIEICDHHGLYGQFDIATSPSNLVIPFRAVDSGNDLTVSVVSLRDNPRDSWSAASRTNVALTVLPVGTHPIPSLGARTRSWLQRTFQRRQGGTA